MRLKGRPAPLLITFAIVAACGLLIAVAGTGSTDVVYETPDPDWNWSGPSLADEFFALLLDESELRQVESALPEQVWERSRDRLEGWLNDGNIAVIVAYLGEASTGGYAIRVRSVHVKRGTSPSVTIAIARRRPDPDEFVTQVVTYPLEIVPIERDMLPEAPFDVRFVDVDGQPLHFEGDAG